MEKMWLVCGVLLVLVTFVACGGGGGGGGGPTNVAFLRSAGGAGSETAYAVATFSDGSSVVTGQFNGPTTWGLGEPNATTLVSAGGFDVFVARYQPDGRLAWVKRAGGALTDRGRGIAAVPDGSCLVTGHFEDVATFGPGEGNQTVLDDVDDGGDVFLARYLPDGTLAWAKRAGRNGPDSGIDVSAHPDGSCVVTGNYDLIAVFGPGETNQTTLTSAGVRDVFVAAYHPSGALAWARSAGGAGTDYGDGVHMFADGSSLVTGYYAGPTATFGFGDPNETTLPNIGDFDVFVARYDADGTLAWVRRASGPGYEEGLAVSAFGDGGFVVGGFFSQTTIFGPGETNQTSLTSLANSNDLFLARYAADGSLLWARQAGSAGNGETVTEVAALPDGSSAFTGIFQGTAIFDPSGPGETAVTAAGGRDIVVARYDPSGNPIWIRSAGGPGHDAGTSIARHVDGSFAVCGTVSPFAVFNAGAPDEMTLPGAGGPDAFVARYNADGSLSP